MPIIRTSMPEGTLIGRAEELERIAEVVRGAASSPGALVLAGEPGIGKTGLLSAAADLARCEHRDILSTAGVELEVQWAYAGLHRLLSPRLAELATLPERERAGLATAFGIETGPTPEPLLVARATLGLILGGHPVPPVLIVDDLQWLDEPTLEVVAYLSRHADNGAFPLLAASRLGHDERISAVRGRRLVVGGLDPDSSERLLLNEEPRLTAGERHRILGEARGNPLAILELPAVTDPRGSGGPLTYRLERAFGARIGELSPAARTLLLLAALEPDGEVGDLLAASRLTSSAATSDDIQDAISAHLVERQGDSLAFRHPLVRSAVLASESLERRQLAHAALARMISDPHVAAIHEAQSVVGPDDAIAARLIAAADAALARGAVVTAVECFECAAALTSATPRRGEILLRAAEEAFGIGRADLVARLLHEAGTLHLDRLARARMELLREIFNDGVPGDAGRVAELCEAARDAWTADLGLALDLLLGAALRCWWADAGSDAVRRVVRTTLQLEAENPAVRSDARFPAVLGVADPVGQGRRVSDLLADRSNDVDAPDLRHLGMAAHSIGAEPLAARLLHTAAVELRAEGRTALLAQVLSMTVAVLIEVGDLDGATAAANEGARLAEESGQPIWTAGTMVCDARVYALRGDTERALDLATRAEMAASRGRLNDLLCYVALARATAGLASGDAAVAYLTLRALFDPASPTFHPRERFDGIVMLAEAARDEPERRAETRGILADLARVAELTPSPLLHAHLACARLILATDDEWAVAAHDARNAGLSNWPWLLAHVELAIGRRLRAAADPAAADALERARVLFDRVGARPWALQAEGELAKVAARGAG